MNDYGPYDRVCAGKVESLAVGSANAPVLVLEAGVAPGWVDVIRVEIGADQSATPFDEVQEVQFYLNDVVGGTGTGITERVIRGAGSAQGVASFGRSNLGATPELFHRGAYHWQAGYLYLPLPEERPRLIAGGPKDVFGFYFPVLQQTIVLSATIIWGELST